MYNKITIGITTYNSHTWVEKQLNLNYIKNLKNLVDEIVIQDDCSSDYNVLKKYETENIKIFTNEKNLSPLLNRVELLKNCKNDWVLLMDSDNSISFTSQNGVDWEKTVSQFDFTDKKTIYSPGFINHYGYKNILELKMDLNFFKKNLLDKNYYLEMLGNTGNYLVPRKEYLEISKQIDNNFCHYIGEVLYFNYLWLKNGNYIICKNNFEYNHEIRDDGYTIVNLEKSRSKLREIYNLFEN
jgi:glycosyltransferase involved in cell wall biosynthesis